MDSINAKDNSYELNCFRGFRDNWLIHQDNGNAIIEEYYNIAPNIVLSINKNEKRKEIYKEIYTNYLSEALIFIEQKKYEEAKSIYTEMVEKLKSKFL